jgi:hypothetical protein
MAGGRRQDKETPLQFTEFINWVGRKCLYGTSNSFFKILAPSSCHMLTATKKGSRHNANEQLQLPNGCLKGKCSIILKQICYWYYAF